VNFHIATRAKTRPSRAIDPKIRGSVKWLTHLLYLAWLMGLEGAIGVIAPGKLADIVIWNSHPVADITVPQ
jgi:predicted amidohydrolase YtcJ